MSDDKTVPSTCVHREEPKGLGGQDIVMEPLSGETPWQQAKPDVKPENETDSGIHSGGSSPTNSVATEASYPSPGGTPTYYKSASSPPRSANLGAPAQSPPPADETNRQQEEQAAADAKPPAQQMDVVAVPVPTTVGSHGRVKTYRCRQCAFQGATKEEFWDHMKTNHIRPEKLLECSECSFVTEYKHHLEYHLNNHKGAKPYKCDKCPYACVNKSMLNSHMKSHSDIHQYACADCHYASKYCHSLKIHLRKYEHKPAMVLNPDGTPNPLPIIDVYGTRRGPRNNRSSLRQQSPPPAPVSPPQQHLHPADLVQVMLAVTRERLGYPYNMLEQLPPLANPLFLNQLAAFRQQQQQAANNVAEEPAPVVNADGVLDLSRPERSPSSTSGSSEDEAMACNDDVENNNCADRLSSGNNTNNYECPYCTIAFGDAVLYTMHMGYHGFGNPFTCNNCGEECGDKISFFVHIARTPHN